MSVVLICKLMSPKECKQVPGVPGTVTESQNFRGWQGPLWVTQSNPLPKQGHPEQAAQDLVQAGLEYLQRRRLHSLPGQPQPLPGKGDAERLQGGSETDTPHCVVPLCSTTFWWFEKKKMVSGAQAKLAAFVCTTSCGSGLVFQEYAAISVVLPHTSCRELPK